MRINNFVAQATGLARRKADQLLAQSRIKVNGQIAKLGQQVAKTDKVTLDDQEIALKDTVTVKINKPVGYVVSRDAQGAHSIYELIPPNYHNLKPVGRLDKDSSGLLILTNDGQLAHELTHPSFEKDKQYLVTLNKNLVESDRSKVISGVMLEDGISKLTVNPLEEARSYLVTMKEGRNRQIRRTFASLGYKVTKLHRTIFGPYSLGNLKEGQINIVLTDKR